MYRIMWLTADGEPRAWNGFATPEEAINNMPMVTHRSRRCWIERDGDPNERYDAAPGVSGSAAAVPGVLDRSVV